MIRCRRACRGSQPDDGVRVLVDRYRPRGVSRESLRLDAWMRRLAPRDVLGERFDHDPPS